VKIDDYIHGLRTGRAAHDIELASMRDGLLGDAIDGFDAVAGDHAAAIGRLADKIQSSALAGRASARARTSRLRERRVKGWSIAAATMFLAGVVGGAVWLMQDGVQTGASPSLEVPRRGGSTIDIEPTLPPVTVIPNDADDTATPQAPSDISGVKLDPDEVRRAPTDPAVDTVRTDTMRKNYPKN
jgi:hypothetical protein